MRRKGGEASYHPVAFALAARKSLFGGDVFWGVADFSSTAPQSAAAADEKTAPRVECE